MTSTARRILFMTFSAACAGPSASAGGGSTPAKTGAKPVDVHEQVWDASRATDGSCVAVPRCGEVPGTACTAPAQTGTVVFANTTCLGAATRWEIVRHSVGGHCTVQNLSCKPGTRCVPPSRPKIACPAPMVAATSTPTPEPVNEDFSVSAAKNVEKGNAALARRDYATAKRFYDFVASRFPRSSYLHDAELGLLHVEVSQAEVIDGDTTNGYCNFIEHHPWHSSVQSGELACRVDTLQGKKCKQGAKMSQYCGKPSYCAADAKRAGCE